jgi:hypothetical protein
MVGSSLAIVHPLDEQKSIKMYWDDTVILVASNLVGKGHSTVLTAAAVLDCVLDGKLTIKAVIQNDLANKEISLVN